MSATPAASGPEQQEPLGPSDRPVEPVEPVEPDRPPEPTAPSGPPGRAGADEVPELSDGDYRALARFRHALRVFLRFSEDAARSAGIAPNQHQLLLAIRGWPGTGAGTVDGTDGGSEAERAPTIGDMAAGLQLQHHSVVELVDRAEQAGLVRRHTDPRDRRRQRLSLTPEGARRLAALTATHRDELRRFRDEMADVLNELG